MNAITEAPRLVLCVTTMAVVDVLLPQQQTRTGKTNVSHALGHNI